MPRFNKLSNRYYHRSRTTTNHRKGRDDKVNQDVRATLECILDLVSLPSEEVTVNPVVEQQVTAQICQSVKETVDQITDSVCAPTEIFKFHPWNPSEKNMNNFDWAAVRCTTKCPSCPKRFPCHIDTRTKDFKKFLHPSFFSHCAVQCEHHRDLVRYCNKCMSSFVDENLEQFHLQFCSKIKDENISKQHEKLGASSERMPSGFMAVPHFQTNDTIRTMAVGSSENLISLYQIKCPCCQMKYPAEIDKFGQLIPYPSYLDHCLKYCESYDRAVECKKCHTIFINKAARSDHKKTVHEGCRLETFTFDYDDYVDWCEEEVEERKRIQTELIHELGRARTVQTSVKPEPPREPEFTISCPPVMKSYTLTKACLGCRQKFPAGVAADGEVVPHLSFYSHCIFKCSKYANKRNIPACTKCYKIFLNQFEFDEHLERVHEQQKKIVPAKQSTETVSKKSRKPRSKRSTSAPESKVTIVFPPTVSNITPMSKIPARQTSSKLLPFKEHYVWDPIGPRRRSLSKDGFTSGLKRGQRNGSPRGSSSQESFQFISNFIARNSTIRFASLRPSTQSKSVQVAVSNERARKRAQPAQPK